MYLILQSKVAFDTLFSGWQFTGVAVFYALAVLMGAYMSFYVWDFRRVRGGLAFFFVCLFSSIYCSGYLLGFFHTCMAVKWFFIRVEYFGLMGLVVAWMAFVLEYTMNKTLPKSFLLGISAIPAFSFLLVLSFPYHPFFYENISLVNEYGMVVTKKDYGIGFYLWTITAYSYIILIQLFLVQRLSKAPRQFKGQTFALVVAGFVPMLPNLLYLATKNPFAPYDLTSLSFFLLGIMYFQIIRKNQFIDVLPLAKQKAIPLFPVPVVIVSSQGQILFANSEVHHRLLFSEQNTNLEGQSINELFPDLNVVFEADDAPWLGRKTQTQLMEVSGTKFQVSASPLYEDSGRVFLGYLISFLNIDDVYRLQKQMQGWKDLIARDLNKPLHSMMWLINNLLDDSNSASERRDILLAMDKSLKTMQEKMSHLSHDIDDAGRGF